MSKTKKELLQTLRECSVCFLQVCCTETWLKVSKQEVKYFIELHYENKEFYFSISDNNMYLSIVE